MGWTGYLDLAACFDGAEYISAYALAYVYSRKEQEVALLTGSDDGMRLWLNGQSIFAFPNGRSPVPEPDEDRVAAKLRRGWNTLLIKVVNDTGRHGLFLRLSADPRELALRVPSKPARSRYFCSAPPRQCRRAMGTPTGSRSLP